MNKAKKILNDINYIYLERNKIKISYENIIRIKGFSNYSMIYSEDGQAFVSTKTLKYFEEIDIKNNLVRTHKTHIVNPIHVSKLKLFAKNPHLLLKNGEEIEVSRRKLKEVTTYFK